MMKVLVTKKLKKISGDELREILTDFDNVFDLCTVTLMSDIYLTSTNY